MRKYLHIIDRHRATKWMRFFNILIDRIAFNCIFLALGFLGGILDGIFGIYYFTKFFYKLAELGRVADIIITSVIFFFYIFLIEYFTKGRSLGKYITGTKVIMTDGKEPTISDYFMRNIIRLVPFDAYLFLEKMDGTIAGVIPELLTLKIMRLKDRPRTKLMPSE